MNAITTDVEPKHAQDHLSPGLLGWTERGLVPDALVRLGIRALCKRRLAAELAGNAEQQAVRFQAGIESLRESPIAIHTDAANAQHYELPPAFFQAIGRVCSSTRSVTYCSFTRSFWKRGSRAIRSSSPPSR